MNVVAIVQARMGSTRLPGKILMDVAGEPMLTRVMNRLQRAQMLNRIVIATTTESVDDQLAAFCDHQQWHFSRGSQNDVLDRYFKTATQHQAEVIVRITSDCPLIEPEIIDKIVSQFLTPDNTFDYMANFLPHRTFPRGLDTEVFSMKALRRAWQEDKDIATREHVTPYLYQHPAMFSIGGFTNVADYSAQRWTVDTPEDLELIRRVYAYFRHDRFNWHSVLTLLEENPDWLLLNQHIEQKKIGAS